MWKFSWNRLSIPDEVCDVHGLSKGGLKVFFPYHHGLGRFSLPTASVPIKLKNPSCRLRFQMGVKLLRRRFFLSRCFCSWFATVRRFLLSGGGSFFFYEKHPIIISLTIWNYKRGNFCHESLHNAIPLRYKRCKIRDLFWFSLVCFGVSLAFWCIKLAVS